MVSSIDLRRSAIRRVALIVATAALAPGGCGRDADTPEARIRATLDGAVRAAEDRDLAGVQEVLSDRFRAGSGEDKQAMAALLTGYLRRPTFLSILHRVKTVTLTEPGSADVVLLLAFASKEIPGAESLVEVSADVFRVELTMAKEDGSWRVTAASWRRIQAADFL